MSGKAPGMSAQPQPPVIAALGHLNRRFLLWKQAKVKGRQTKIPLQANGKNAQTNKVQTWCTMPQAMEALDRIQADGVGIVLGQLAENRWLVGGDLDLCRSPITGRIEPW